MKLIMSSVVVLVAALSVGIAAQSGDTMAKGEKMDKMATKDATHSGCIEAGSAPGTFTLTHLAADDHMAKDAMKTMTKESMSKGAMAPPTLSLTSTSVDQRDSSPAARRRRRRPAPPPASSDDE